jgi:pyruvate dehydrogenase E2 component (dihydrolipoamide acetyltransferase)
MAEIIRMPKMSDTMTEGTIATWLKQVGDKVKSGDVLAEVETDKATMELENYTDGTLLYIGPKNGEAVAVDGVLAIIGKPGEDYQALLGGQSGGSAAPVPAAPPVAAASPAPAPAPVVVASAGNGKKATVVRMPKMSDTMTEGTIATWLKKVGDKVKAGDVLAEVETDKATMELENYEDGTLLYIGAKDGEAVAVDGVLAIIGQEGADIQALLNGGSGGGQAPAAAQAVADAAPAATAVPAAVTAPASDNGRLFVSPLARKMAEDKGIDLRTVKGSGENGRIVSRDIEAFQAPAAVTPAPVVATVAVAASAPAPAAAAGTYTDTPVSQMRKVIAKRLAESKFSAPHFYLTMEIVMDEAMAARTKLNQLSPVKLSFNDLVIKACAAALRQHPTINSSWLGDRIRTNHVVNIGVAVAVEDGLLVPVVRNADQKGLAQIAKEVKELADKAKTKKLQPQEWEGNTFTISNRGRYQTDGGGKSRPTRCRQRDESDALLRSPRGGRRKRRRLPANPQSAARRADADAGVEAAHQMAGVFVASPSGF